MHDATLGYARGELIHQAGERGGAWRIIAGVVRLDRNSEGGRMFAGLARPGDVIGMEAMADRTYAFDALALCDCRLAPWQEPGQNADQDSLLQMLLAVERRSAEILALRCGDALARVKRLILMLADGHSDPIAIPLARDMADITGLTAETVSRAFSVLRRQGILHKQGARLGRVCRPDWQPA